MNHPFFTSRKTPETLPLCALTRIPTERELFAEKYGSDDDKENKENSRIAVNDELNKKMICYETCNHISNEPKYHSFHF